MTNLQLIEAAKKASENAYAPYSHFYVGAALLTKSGKVYLGCNIENSSYGATNCAERTAIFNAMSAGEREFEKIAVIAKDGSTAFPCGICLQVMHEVMPEGIVILENGEEIVEYHLKDLLPFGFDL